MGSHEARTRIRQLEYLASVIDGCVMDGCADFCRGHLVKDEHAWDAWNELLDLYDNHQHFKNYVAICRDCTNPALLLSVFDAYYEEVERNGGRAALAKDITTLDNRQVRQL